MTTGASGHPRSQAGRYSASERMAVPIICGSLDKSMWPQRREYILDHIVERQEQGILAE